MAVADDLERIASAAARPGERLTGILVAELLDASRVYLCAYESGAWLALDDGGQPVTSRRAVHEAASLCALCELAEEVAGIDPGGPRLATVEYLDRIGAGAGAAFEQSMASVNALADQVLARHLTALA